MRAVTSLLQSRWFAPVLHLVLFSITWLTAYFLFFTDLPVSVIASSAIWNGMLILGLLLWGTVGTLCWYLLGLWLQGLRNSVDHRSS